MAKVIPIRPDDEASRERIRRSLDESLIVEAAAGTGKTTELICRIVAGFRAGRIRKAENLVAVTFTRKAAGELKLRLRQELDSALQNAFAPDRLAPAGLSAGEEEAEGTKPARKSGRSVTTASSSPSSTTDLPGDVLGEPGQPSAPVASEIQNLEDAITHLEEAHIGTIHSFCAEILRERPVEANVDPAFHELSDPESQRIYRQAFRRWSQQKLSSSPPGLRRCLSRLAARSASDDSSPLDAVGAAGWNLVQWRDFSKPWQRRPFNREAAIDSLVEEVFRLADLLLTCPRQSDDLVLALRPLRALRTW